MESIDENFAKGSFGISEASRQHFRETAKWAKFLSIVGFIGLGLMVLGGLMFLSMGNEIRYGMMRSGNDLPVGAMAFAYVLAAVIYFFPIFYLFKFSVKMQGAVESSDPIGFEEATGFLKSHYKYIGIMMIIVLSLYALLFVVGILAAAGR